MPQNVTMLLQLNVEGERNVLAHSSGAGLLQKKD